MKKWSFRKKITVIFAALQVLGIGVGCALALLTWKQMQTVRHLEQVSWPSANAAMEMRVLSLREKAELACAHCHEYRYGGIAVLDSMRSLELDQLRHLNPTLHALTDARLAELQLRSHDQLQELWPDLQLLTAQLQKLGPDFVRRHTGAMKAVEETASQLDSLFQETESQIKAEMVNRSREATWYAYAGLVSLTLLGLVMIGATWRFGKLVRHQVSDPIERMAAEVEGVDFRQPGFRVSVPEVAELEVLARTLNRALEGLELAQAERHQLDRHLIQTERLAAVGVVAAGIVHNLKNPLSAILGFAELLSFSHPELTEAGYIVEATEKMNRMIEEILAKGRKTRTVERVDLNVLLQRELDFLQADMMFKHKVEKELHFADQLPAVNCVYTDLSQVFANLLQNAVDAMRDQQVKRLRVRTASTQTHLEVEVSDTGCGIPESARAHLFEPFFTTKGSGSGPTGTGLGLYTAQRLLEGYQASIEVESAVGQGTTFKVKIPLVRQS